VPGSIADVLLVTPGLADIVRETEVQGYGSHRRPTSSFRPSVSSGAAGLRAGLAQARSPPPTRSIASFSIARRRWERSRSAQTADLLIIPTQCEFFSAFALRQVINLVRSVRERTNPGLRYRLLLTMVDLRNALHRSLAEEIRLAFGAAVFRSAIEVDARLRESPAFGQPITLYAPASRGAQQYRDLAQELREHVQETLAQVA
jgi:hypothetical protein